MQTRLSFESGILFVATQVEDHVFSTKTAIRAITSMRFVYLFAHPCVSSFLSRMSIQIHHVMMWHYIFKIRIALIVAVNPGALISYGRLRISWYIHSR